MKRYIIAAIGMIATICASAQNLNPTVQVTNDYEGRFMEVQKMNLQMAVPDSLTRFDWNFNYSVFDNPYKGAYEFNPYLIDMKPEPVPYDGKSLYLRAGAGYTLHPELQAVWSPVLRNGLKITVYDSFKGYWGQYQSFNVNEREIVGSADPADGNDSGNRFGIFARYDFKPVILSLDGKFDWLNSRSIQDFKNNVLGESVSLRARSNAVSPFQFDVNAEFKNLSDRSEWSPSLSDMYTFLPIQEGEPSESGEKCFNADGSFAYDFSDSFRAGLHASYERFLFNADEINVCTGLIDVLPSFTYSLDRFTASAGVRISDVIKDSDGQPVVTPDGDPNGLIADYDVQKVFPRVHVGYEIMEEALQVFADIDGGNRFNSFSSYLESNHFFSGHLGGLYPSFFGDASVNAVDASLGLSGRIRSRIQFSLEGGFSKWKNLPMEGLAAPAYVPDGLALLNYSFVNMDLLYAELAAGWNSDRLDASGLFKVQKSDFAENTGAVSLPLFSGSADVTYNWNRRFFAGVSAGWMTGRECLWDADVMDPSSVESEQSVAVPAWVDLGVNMEYRATGRLSFWLKGGNLLNQSVMHNMLVVERGPYFTAGICFCM